MMGLRSIDTWSFQLQLHWARSVCVPNSTTVQPGHYPILLQNEIMKTQVIPSPPRFFVFSQ